MKTDEKAFKCTLFLNSLYFWPACTLSVEPCPPPVVFRTGKGTSGPCYVLPLGHQLPLQHLLPIQSWPELQQGPRLPAGRTASPVLFSRNNCACSNRATNTRVSIVDLLRHNPASPPLYCKKEARTAAPPVQTEKTDPLCSPCPFSASTEVHDPPLLPPATPKASKHSHFASFPPSASSSGWQGSRSSYENSENML